MNALPLLLIGGAAVVLLGKKKRRRTTADQKTPSGGIANPASTYCIEQGGEVDIREDEEGNQYGVCVFPDGKEVQEAAFYKGDDKPRFPGPESPGDNGWAEQPWWTIVMGTARAQAEERAKQCSNPEAFLAAVDQAFKPRRDEYLDDVKAESLATGVRGGGEGTQLGITFQSDLQMFVDDLFTVHCG